MCSVQHCHANSDSVLVVSAPAEPIRTADVCAAHAEAIAQGERWAWEPTSPGCGRILIGLELGLRTEPAAVDRRTTSSA
ncbi:MAG: hypothetical protein JWO63_735 [Frankiales bacterium]|nr:hypothetical protein [Frankiales bacterium]